MRILTILVILCALFCTACAPKHQKATPIQINYDAGVAAYKRGDYKVALYDFEPRAMTGDPVAQFCLGLMYTHALGVEKDLIKAAEWYLRVGEEPQSYPPAKNNLGLTVVRLIEDIRRNPTKYTEDQKVIINRELKPKVVPYFQSLSEHGNLIAQYNLGVIYSHGYRVDRNLKTAAEWYQKAADQGYARAQNELGLMYLEGKGVEKNIKEATKLFKMAADQGYSPAQHNFGLRYLKGEGIEKNLKRAAYLFAMALKEGHHPAQYQLAGMYLKGEGIEKNLKRAAYLFAMAAEQGNTLAQHQLAMMYNGGNGIPKNRKKATRIVFLAAQQGYAIAQADFGRAIAEYDSEEAYYWYSLAIKNMASLKFLDETGRENRIAKTTSEHERIGKTLTAQQRNEIQKQVDNWKPKRQVSSGTGFYINEKNILTNAHVVSEYDEIRVPYRPVKVEAIDTNYKESGIDLALLSDPRGKKDTATFRSKSIVPGEDAFVFGYPLHGTLSYDGNFTEGNISGLLGSPDLPHPENLFQYTAPTQNGNSGGPVLDDAGNVIGVVVSGFDPSLMIKDGRVEIRGPQNVNFAIKFEVVEDFLKKNNSTDYASTENLGSPIDKQEIAKKARKWTVPVLRFKNIGETPLPLVEISIDEQFKF